MAQSTDGTDAGTMFQFECADGRVDRPIGCVARIFPQDTPIATLLSSTRWTAKPPTSTRLCANYGCETVQFVLDFLEHGRQLRVDEQRVWAVRAEFVSMCDLLLLADTFAGLVARTLSKIAESATVEVVYGRSLSSSPSPHPSEHPAVRVSVRVRPCLAPFGPFGLDLIGVPRGRFWTEPVVVKHAEHAHVSSVQELIDIAAAAASRWTIAPLFDRTVTSGTQHLPECTTGTSRDASAGRQASLPSGSVALFRPLGVYKEPVVVPIADLDQAYVADRIKELVELPCVDPICTLRPESPYLPRLRTVSVAGGTDSTRLLMASRLAARMCASRTIIYMAHTRCDRVRQYFPRALMTDRHDDEAHRDPSAVLVVFIGLVEPVDQKPLVTYLHPHGPRIIYLALKAHCLSHTIGVRWRSHTIDAAYLFYDADNDAAVDKDDLKSHSHWLCQVASTEMMRACAARARDYGATVCMTLARDGSVTVSLERGDSRAVIRCADCQANHLHSQVDRLCLSGSAPFFPPDNYPKTKYSV
ncbi:hypothetical protein pqer_cds_658 [Pandoravirus quercus]|uniref:Uncharacterized protein n=1 Tax=Pandoravirus quercus TaxID=2107709 RepID=A0A2U7U9M6_9VIRU|nr:hypothetical protein pqer_cds_658 [Pandoravirus quercus]AVK75080.1 hypothetical protein pqer_cds_658 [Pandoravirus quercus]